MKKNKKAGFILSAELILIATIVVMGLLVGLVAMRDAMIGELHDTAEAYGAVTQSYTFNGTEHQGSWTRGSEWADDTDAGDLEPVLVDLDPVPES